jgi:hypothetical protein
MREDKQNYGVVMKIINFLVKLLAFALVGIFVGFLLIANAMLGACVWLPSTVIYGGKAAFDFVFRRNRGPKSF